MGWCWHFNVATPQQGVGNWLEPPESLEWLLILANKAFEMVYLYQSMYPPPSPQYKRKLQTTCVHICCLISSIIYIYMHIYIIYIIYIRDLYPWIWETMVRVTKGNSCTRRRHPSWPLLFSRWGWHGSISGVEHFSLVKINIEDVPVLSSCLGELFMHRASGCP